MMENKVEVFEHEVFGGVEAFIIKDSPYFTENLLQSC